MACAPGMPGKFSPPPRISDPDMHHGTCVTHVPWCMSGSLTSGFFEVVPGKRSRYSRCMRNPQLYVSGKRPMWCENLRTVCVGRICTRVPHTALMVCMFLQHLATVNKPADLLMWRISSFKNPEAFTNCIFEEYCIFEWICIRNPCKDTP